MASESSPFTKRIRQLSIALVISGIVNIGVLSFLLYWLLRESPPTPYCELKPASYEQQQIPLADHRGCAEILAHLSHLTFPELISHLSHSQLIENGYAERDLALACLVAFHHFDMQRAISKNAPLQQQRILSWKPKDQEAAITLVVYPDLSEKQYQALMKFAKTENWPLTPEGLFLSLKEQKSSGHLDDNLVETFVLTTEFWTVELLFNRSAQRATKKELLEILLEGDWKLLKQFMDQQRLLHDSSDARRHKFLLDYIKAGSPSAALFLLKTEWEFAVKKIDDQQVIEIVELMPFQSVDGMRFVKEMLASPRSTLVWQKASKWLYTQAGESLPRDWNYQVALSRFLPDIVRTEVFTRTPAVAKTILPLQIQSNNGENNLSAPSTSGVSTSKWQKTAVVKKTQLSKKIREHTVETGDSLWKIAKRYGAKVEEIRTYNALQSDVLKPGEVLKIP